MLPPGEWKSIARIIGHELSVSTTRHTSSVGRCVLVCLCNIVLLGRIAARSARDAGYFYRRCRVVCLHVCVFVLT